MRDYHQNLTRWFTVAGLLVAVASLARGEPRVQPGVQPRVQPRFQPIVPPPGSAAPETSEQKPVKKPAKKPKVEVACLGPAREISHSSSASRDTFALGLIFAPRPVLSGGGDLAFFSLRAAGLTFRLGFQGMLELESKNKLDKNTQALVGDIHFWRGVYGLSLATSLDRLAERWLGKGSALEATLSYRHESEHYTGSNNGGEGIDYSDRPHIGDFIMLDVALRYRLGKIDLIARLQHKFFLPKRSAYLQGGGADLILRWRLTHWIHPFISLFGEYVFGAVVHDHELGGGLPVRVPDHYLFRALVGGILPSKAGDLYLFVSTDVGHRKGLAVFTEEFAFTVGVRAVFF